MANYAHELFLLSTNLTQFKSKVLITKIFVESINSLFSGHKFNWSEEIVENAEKGLKVCTRSKTYGYISFSNQQTFTEETFSLLQNAVQWLAILFEKLEQETLLNNQKEHLNSLVEEKTKDLVESQKHLYETSKMAMVGGWQIDFYGNTLNWTSETYRIHELSEGSVPDVANAIQYYHPDDQQMVNDCVQKSIEKRESFDFEARLITAKGNMKWVRALGKTVSKDGKSIGIHGMIQDITKQKLAEETILKNQFYLSKAQEIGKIGTWELDIINNKLIWTKENYKNFGVKHGTPLTYEIFLNCIHPNDRDYVNSEWGAAIKGKPYDVEHRVVADGKVKWLRGKADIKFDENGKAISAIGFTQDITKYKESVLKIKESERKFRILADNTNDWEYWINENNEYVFISPSCKKITGYSEVEFYKNPDLFTELVRKDYKGEVFIHYHDANRTKPLFTSEFPIINKDNKEIWIEHSCVPIFDDEGNFLGRRGRNRDITDKKNAENELKKSESIQRKMVANIGDVIVIIDKNGINRYKSPNVKKQFGWEVDELVGKSAWDKVHSDDIESAKKVLADLAYEPKKSTTTEVRYLRKDGEYRWIEITISNLLNDPEINGFLGNYHDITERKLAEEALRSSQEMLLSSQSLANICSYSTNLIVTDIDKSHWECSPEFYKIFGIDETYPHTIEGWIGFLHPDYREDVAAYHESVVLEKKSFNREYKIIRINDGVERWVHGTGELVYDEKGNPIRMHGAIQDITEHKLAELALKESENKFKTLFKDNNSIQLLIEPSTGNIIDANQAACDFYGYAYEKLTALSIQDINQYNEEEVKQEMNSAKEKKRNYFEFTHKLKDGTIREVEVFSNPISIDNVQYLISIIHDITTKKRAERELIKTKEKAEERNNQVNAMLDAIPDLVFRVDGNGVILDYKADVKDLYYQKTSIIGKKYHDVLPQNIVELIDKNIKLTLDKNSIQTFEYTLHMPTVGNCEYEARMTKSGPNEVTVLVRDITETNKNRSELIVAKEKAEESDRLKSAFLANMSHEIRTPMNGILGFTSLLQNSNLSVENQKNYIDIIEKSGNRLLNTVNDIIEISRIESGEIKVAKSEVDIIGHLDTLVTFFRPEAKKKNIDIIVENSIDGNDLTITTDKNKLSSILSNLIKNAIKYTNDGTIKVGLEVENNQILFSCKDTGIGIPKNRQEAIFNRFEQADIEDKHAHQGSGLGLAIVKSYVEILNGKIWVESEVGQGSTFYVSFPYEHEKKEEQIIPQEAKPSDSGIKNINVLIVEDDEYSSMHLLEVMKGITKNIRTAKNGIEAIDTCKNDSEIDLILMDIKMPVMGGIEATKKIREFNKGVVIIAQTAYALQGDKEKALDAGCDDYISKPIKKDKLFELINKYF